MTVPNQVTSDRSPEEIRLIVTLVRKALLDPGLSFRAQGMFCNITEASGGRGLGMAEILALSTDGTAAVKQGVKELVNSGYLVMRTLRNPNGTMGGTIYQPAEGQPTERSLTGFAYAISAPDRKLVKIGCTGDLRKRLGALQSASPLPLAIIWRQVGGYALEQHLHQTLSRRRVRGEWFDFADTDAVWMINRAAQLFESE